MAIAWYHKIFIAFLFIFVLTIFSISKVSAQSAASPAENKALESYTDLTKELKPPQLQIRIPGLTFSDVSRTVDEQGYINVPFLGEYIGAVYKFGMVAASILAVILIIVQGFEIVTGGGEENAHHYQNIFRIVIGLFILWTSYFILYTLNPDLVNFKLLRVKYIEPQDYLVDAETEEAVALPDTQPNVQPKIQPAIRIKSDYLANSMKVGEGIAEDIQKAAQELYTETKSMTGGPYKLSGGGYRDLAETRNSQVEKWARQCEGKKTCGIPVCNPFPKSALDENNRRKPGATPDPTLCPHTSGLALDIYCQGYSDKEFYAPCQRKLEEIMLRHGFCRLTSEPWHFEKPKMSGTCTNITGTATRRTTNTTWEYSACDGVYNLKRKTCTPLPNT